MATKRSKQFKKEALPILSQSLPFGQTCPVFRKERFYSNKKESSEFKLRKP